MGYILKEYVTAEYECFRITLPLGSVSVVQVTNTFPVHFFVIAHCFDISCTQNKIPWPNIPSETLETQDSNFS